MKHTFEMKQAAEKLGMSIIEVMENIDSWNPAACRIEELIFEISEIEAIEAIGASITSRADYLRGVMAGRIIHECSKND